MMFKAKQLVLHLKTGKVYRIIYTPKRGRLEATNEPAYAYTMWNPFEKEDGPIWFRSQTEMEDGRFIQC